MPDVKVTYKNSVIHQSSISGGKTLKTAGKVCEDDIQIIYQKPTARPEDTDKISFSTYINSRGEIYKRCYISTGKPYALAAKNKAVFVPDFSLPFEIGIVFKINSLEIDKQSLFGGTNTVIPIGTQEYRRPKAVILDNGSVEAYFSTSGADWEKTIALGAGSVQTGVWYHFRYLWDGSFFKIGISTDFESYVEESTSQSTAHYSLDNNGMSFGDSITGERIQNGSINLQGTYINVNDTLVWGCTYCEDKKTFEEY